MDEVQELKKEIQELRVLLEVEKQKSAKIQKELEIAQRKVGKPAGPPPPSPMGTSIPQAVPKPVARQTSSQFDMGGIAATQEELTRLENVLKETQTKLNKVDEEKYDVQRKNIDLKENLQRLKVQGSNHKKDIESLMEKVDRKENQNFKVRLELTDLRKELATSKEEQEAQDKVLRKLEKQITEVQAELEKREAVLKEEIRKRDKITLEYNKARDLLAQYENHWLAHFYNKG